MTRYAKKTQRRVRELAETMTKMPVTLEHARQACGYTDSLPNILQDEQKRAVLFREHSNLCCEVAFYHLEAAESFVESDH